MIGFLAVGHPDYVTDGTALGFAERAAACLRQRGAELIWDGGIRSDVAGARAAALELLGKDADGIVLFAASWLECSVALAAVTELRHLPIFLWSFPMWMEGERECSTGSYVSGAMLQGVFRRMGLSFTSVFGMPEDTADEAAVFCRAAAAVKRLRRSRIGLVGYTSMNILTGSFDHLLLRSRIGPDVEQSDSYSLICLAHESTPEELDEARAELSRRFRVDERLSPSRLDKCMGLYLALKKLREKQGLDAVNVKCQYEFSKEYGMTVCVPLSLAASPEYITSCEGDLFCTVSQLILRYLTGQCCAYGDAITDRDGVLRVSPCGYMPPELTADGADCVEFPAGFGFDGIISSCVMKPGRVTLLRLVEDVGSYHFVYCTGEGLADTKRRQGIFPALDVRLDGDTAALRREYAGQHFALCYGDVSRELEALAGMLKIGAVGIR